ncbi:WD domain repeat-containing protein 55 [Balamuthia mandrillaris]
MQPFTASPGSPQENAQHQIPYIQLMEEIQCSDMSFHPQQDLLALGLIDNSVQIYAYSAEGTASCIQQYNHHNGPVRCLSFSEEGKFLFTGSSDCSLAAIDATTGKIVFQKANAHPDPLQCIATKESVLVTGDEEGCLKVWDLRQSKQVFCWEEHEDYISDIVIDYNRNTILATSGDGFLSVWHMRRGKLEAMSDNIEDELLSMAIIKEGSKVVVGTTEGILTIWSWGDWGDMSDRFPGHPQSIDAIIPIDDDTICTGSSDGLIRIVSIQPNGLLGLVGEHGELPIECLRLSHDKRWMASTSHDSCVRFFDVAYLYSDDGDDDEEGENDEKQKEKEKEPEHNSEHMDEVKDNTCNSELQPTGTAKKKKKKGRSKGRGFFSGLE